MGYTQFTVQKIEGILSQFAPIRSVLDLGAQNNYSVALIRAEDAPYISTWYQNRGIAYQCIDLNGENGAIPMDLSKWHAFNNYSETEMVLTHENGAFQIMPIVDLLVDAGTSEHVGHNGTFAWEAIYNCWATKYNLLRPGGIMYNENPATGNWPGHGFNYYTEAFYLELAEKHGLFAIHDLGHHPAMGNEVDGYNIYSTLQKHADAPPFITLAEFMKLDIRQQ